MKVLLRLLVLVLVFIGLSLGSYWVIFSQGLISGLLLSLLLLIGCFALFLLSLYGIEQEELPSLRLATRMEVMGLLIMTGYLSTAIGLFAIGNVIIENKPGEFNYSATEKAAVIASTLLGTAVTAENKDSFTKNGVTYYYTPSTKDEVDKIDAYLQQEKSRIASFFNHDHQEVLNIVFHDDYDTLTEESGHDHAVGFYDYYHQAIHLVPDDYFWEIVLLHEYTHYHSLHFAEENYLSDTRLPTWFEEGLAEYLGGESVPWYEIGEVEIINFKSMNLDYTFHATATRSFDPYVQSYLAVDYIARHHGEDFLFELFNARIFEHFYEILQKETGMTLSVFQETFLDDRKKESELLEAKFDAAYEAMDSEDYAEALNVLEDLAVIAPSEAQYEVASLTTEIHVMQGQFESARTHLEKRIEEEHSLYKVDDTISLAEIYLISDPEKSWSLIKEISKEIDEEDAFYYDIDILLEAYQRVNSNSPADGYLMLLNEDLLWYEKVIEKVEEKADELNRSAKGKHAFPFAGFFFSLF